MPPLHREEDGGQPRRSHARSPGQLTVALGQGEGP